jgi:hypothetical protein
MENSNYFRVKFGEMPVVRVPIILFCDDWSENKSKKWSKFESWCLLLAGLPREENGKLENIHFICTSNKLSGKEMADPLVEDLLDLEHEGVEAYDAFLRRNIIVLAPVIILMADNPMASVFCNHLTGQPKHYCRKCLVCG